MRELLIFIALFSTQFAHAVSPDLKGPVVSTDTVADVYRDMIVVQRKAKEKAKNWTLQAYESMDFSDGPEETYSTNIALGYAFSDTFEVAVNVVPVFLQQDQPIKSTVSNLNLANGQKASLDSPQPKLQYGVDFFWLPMYGKDSWGSHTIVRSDTFLKLSLANVIYSQDSGMRATLGLGKTFFISRYFNPRITGSFGYQQTIVNDVKSFSGMGVLDIGSVWYF